MKFFKSLKKSTIIKIVAVLAVLVVFIVVVRLLTRGGKKDNSAKIQAGIAYLESLEAKNPQDMQEELRQKRRDAQAAKVDEILARIDSGEISVWSQFSDAAILGDSRAEDFVFDGFLTRTNVYAEKGTMCTDAMDYIDTIAAANPSRLFFTYGMNDVDGCWNTAEDFIAAYTKVIQAYMERMPNAVIFVNSIIPVNQHAIDNDSNYVNIPEYNEGMKAMADSLGVCWIDCDNYLDDYPDLYDTDGQHFFPEIYPIWAKDMLKAAFDYEYTNNEEADIVSDVEAAQAAAEQAAAEQAAAESAAAESAAESSQQSAGTDAETAGGTETADQAES